MDANSELVFVYGTLCLGASNHHRMRGAEWVGTASAKGRLYQVSWYPGFVPDETGGKVVGDLYQVTPAHLRKLDEFEGVPSGELAGEEYERRRLCVSLSEAAQDRLEEEKPEVEAWVWVWRKGVEDLLEVATGDWLDVERPRQPPWLTGVGCLGVLGVPVVGSLLIEALRDHASVVLGPGSLGAFMMAGAAMSFVVGIYADRRREPGRPLQVLLLAAAVLLFVAGLLLACGEI